MALRGVRGKLSGGVAELDEIQRQNKVHVRIEAGA